MSDTSLHKCTGNCKIVGFLFEYCETCGWEDGYTGGGSDPYEHNTIEKPFKNVTAMNRKHHCHACAYLRMGVKTRLMPEHTCETIPPIRVSNQPENAAKSTQSSDLLQENEAQKAEITDPISRRILENSGMHL